MLLMWKRRGLHEESRGHALRGGCTPPCPRRETCLKLFSGSATRAWHRMPAHRRIRVMPPSEPSIAVIRQKMLYASALADAVGDAVQAAAPGIVNLEIACQLDGTA